MMQFLAPEDIVAACEHLKEKRGSPDLTPNCLWIYLRELWNLERRCSGHRTKRRNKALTHKPFPIPKSRKHWGKQK